MANKPQRNIINLKDRQLFDTIADLLVVDGSVKITGLGVFEVKQIKGHMGYNPSKKKHEKVEPYKKLIFTPTKKLRVQIQKCRK